MEDIVRRSNSWYYCAQTASCTYIVHYGKSTDDRTPVGWPRMRAWQEEMDTETEAIQAETKVMRDRRMEANMNAWREETMACQGKMEAHLKCEEPTSVDMDLRWHIRRRSPRKKPQ
jgi:hypothetical protein